MERMFAGWKNIICMNGLGNSEDDRTFFLYDFFLINLTGEKAWGKAYAWHDLHHNNRATRTSPAF